MFSRAAIFVAAIAMTAASVQPLAAEEASGRTVAVRQSASAVGPEGERVIRVNAPVFAGDVIKTGRLGSAQILFADNTKLVVGPRSQVTVDAFVFKSPTTASAVSIEALRGSFRFISGASAKSAYTITTPTATIGVRGTSFDGHVGDDGTITIAMWTGAVLLDAGGNREIVSGKCGILVLRPATGFERINGIYERTAVMDRLFPFAFRQGWLQSPFRADTGECENRDFSAPTSQGSNEAPVEEPEIIID